MNLKGLYAFRQVVATGTVTAAARDMNTSVSALSRQLALLEADLGLSLFTRDRHRLNLTREGESFYREASRILVAIDRVPEIVRTIKHQARRTIRAVVSSRLAHTIAVPAVSEFLREESSVEISLEVQAFNLLEHWVASHQFDIGIGPLPARHPSIEPEHLCRLPIVVAVPRDHPWTNRTSVTVAECAEEHVILLENTSTFGRLVRRILDDADIVPRIRTRVSLSRLGCDLVARGVGVMIIDPVTPGTFGDSICLVPLDVPQRLDFGLLYPRDVERTEEVRRLAKLVARQFDTFAGVL